MPKMKIVKGPITPPLLPFVAAVFGDNYRCRMVRATPHDYPPTIAQIDAFLRSLGYVTTGWVVNSRDVPHDSFNHLWVGAVRAGPDQETERLAWQDALANTCDFATEDQP